MTLRLGPAEILFLLLFGGDGQASDLATFLPADQYFKSRKIETTIDNLAALASKEPVDGKTEIAQLLALRTLAERADDVKKVANYKDILTRIEKIAKGEIAKDAHGFSRDHAARLLIVLGGDDKLGSTKSSDLRVDALNWFPQSTTLVGALQLDPRAASEERSQEMRQFWSRFVKPAEWEKAFDMAEKVGNIQVDRFAIAFQEGKKVSEPWRSDGGSIFVRISGKASHERIVKALNTAMGPSPATKRPYVTTRKEKGVLISTFIIIPIEVGLLGDTDLMITTSGELDRPVERMMDVRSLELPSVLKGKVKDSLDKISGKACGLLAGELPKDVSRAFGVVPKSIRAEIIREKLGWDIKLHGSFASADDAKAFVQVVSKYRKMGLETIDKIPKELSIPASTIAALKSSLESIQVRTDGATAVGGLFVSTEALRALPMWLLLRSDD